MANLQTKYLGLSLRNPIVVSSSGLTDTSDKIVKLEEQGAGAVVIKSLFEEQILNQANCLSANEDYPEANDYIQGYLHDHELGQYLSTVEDAKKRCTIPIIASINCVGKGQWVDFSRQVEQAGADAIEVNIFVLPTDSSKPSSYYELQYTDTVREVVDKVKVPVAVKMGRQFTSPLYMLQQLYNHGVKGAVLFNRFYEPDINIDTRRVEAADVFSTEKELSPTLRWLALASAQITELDLAASTGIHTGDDVAKAILAGAAATQVCTTLYQSGTKHIKVMLEELEKALARADFSSVQSMRGALNYAHEGSVGLFERSQFMRYFSNH